MVALVFVVIGEVRGRKTEVEPVALADLAVVALVVLIAALYVVLFERIGFPLATFGLSLCLLVTFARGTSKLWRAVLQAAGITAAVYILFALVFGVRLPQTPFFDVLTSSGAL